MTRPGRRPQRRELLDRLMRRAVLAEPDRVVREDPDRRDLHQRAEADRLARVVGEDQVRRAVGAQLREREAVDDAPPCRARGSRSGGSGRRGRRPRRRPPPRSEPGGGRAGRGPPRRRPATERCGRPRSAPCPTPSGSRLPFSSGGKLGDVAVPALRQLAPLHPLELRRRARGARRGSARRAAPTPLAARARGRRRRRRSARRRRRGSGTARPRASRSCASRARTSSSPSGSPWALAVSWTSGAP